MYIYNGCLYHHGIKGQKWGIRRFQNEDGSLTEEGRSRYGASIERGRTLQKSGKTGKSIAYSGIKKAVVYKLGKVGYDVALSIASAVNYNLVLSGLMAPATFTFATGALGVAGVLGTTAYLTGQAVNAIKTGRNAVDLSRANKVKN